MPKKTVYVREEDLRIWERIENKSAWLSDRLNDRDVVDLKDRRLRQVVKEMVEEAFSERERGY